MDTVNLNNSKRSAKRLVFDRRYGWVIDDWKDPSEEALAGGRGMFCIVPLAKACFSSLSQSINRVAESTIKFIEKPGIISPQVLQSNLFNQVEKIVSSTKKSGVNLPFFKKNLTVESSSRSSNLVRET